MGGFLIANPGARRKVQFDDEGGQAPPPPPPPPPPERQQSISTMKDLAAVSQTYNHSLLAEQSRRSAAGKEVKGASGLVFERTPASFIQPSGGKVHPSGERRRSGSREQDHAHGFSTGSKLTDQLQDQQHLKQPHLIDQKEEHNQFIQTQHDRYNQSTQQHQQQQKQEDHTTYVQQQEHQQQYSQKEQHGNHLHQQQQEPQNSQYQQHGHHAEEHQHSHYQQQYSQYSQQQQQEQLNIQQQHQYSHNLQNKEQINQQHQQQERQYQQQQDSHRVQHQPVYVQQQYNQHQQQQQLEDYRMQHQAATQSDGGHPRRRQHSADSDYKVDLGKVFLFIWTVSTSLCTYKSSLEPYHNQFCGCASLFDADQDADPDLTYHPAADQGYDFLFDPDPDVDPDPIFHPDADSDPDPDPSFK